MDIGYYLKVFVRRLPYFIILFMLGSAIGLTLSVMLPPVYRAEATLLMESEQIPDEMASSTVQTNPIEHLQIIKQRILTREILLEMANRMNIYANTGRAPMAADQKVLDLRQRIGIAIDARRGQARIVTVTFTAPNGPMASRVTNELVTLILQENVEMRTTVASQTLAFFSQEVERLERELSQKSAQILQFKEENLDSLPDSLDFRRSRQATLQERLLQLQRGETVLLDRRDRMVELFEATGRVGPANEQRMSPEERQLVQLERQYTNLLAVLSPDNPKVSVLKSRIDSLKEIVAAQNGATSADGENAGPTPYELQLADLDAQLEFVADQRARIEAELADVTATIEETPSNAVTMETLQREQNNIKTLYNQAVTNRARAETGDTIEALSKGQRISVLEQAVTPREPTSPNRPAIAAAGVAGGLAAGLALVLLLELLNTSVRRPVDLTKKLGITAFGTVPYIWTGPQLLRRRAIIAGALVVVLAGIPAGLWLIDTQITPIQPLIGRILDRLNIPLAGDFPAIAAFV